MVHGYKELKGNHHDSTVPRASVAPASLERDVDLMATIVARLITATKTTAVTGKRYQCYCELCTVYVPQKYVRQSIL